MGYVLGIGIPVLIIGVFGVLIWRVARSGSKKKARNLALMQYAESRGFRWVGDDLNGRVQGLRTGREFSIEFEIVQCSADPSADESSFVPRMTMLETVFRLPLPGVTRRALISKPFFREAIHDPLRGVALTDLGDATYRVFVPPEDSCDWLDVEILSELSVLGARELRLDRSELSLNLDKMQPSPERLDRALDLMETVASRLVT